MSMVSSAFRKVTGQRLSTVIATGAVSQNRTARDGGSILLLAALGVGAFLLLRRKG